MKGVKGGFYVKFERRNKPYWIRHYLPFASNRKRFKKLSIFLFRRRSFIPKKNKELQQTIDEKLKSVPGEYHSEFIEGYGQDLHGNQFLFPSMHRESIFITLYNYLEYSLNEYCRLISKLYESQIKLSDLNHKGVQRAIVYLKKIALLDLSEADTEYAFLTNSNRLRNRIVHAGGILPSNKEEKVNKFIDSQKNLAGSPDHGIIFREEFILKFINNLAGYLKVVGVESIKYVKNITPNQKIQRTI